MMKLKILFSLCWGVHCQCFQSISAAAAEFCFCSQRKLVEPVLKTTCVKRPPFQTPQSTFFSVIHLCVLRDHLS